QRVWTSVWTTGGTCGQPPVRWGRHADQRKHAEKVCPDPLRALPERRRNLSPPSREGRRDLLRRGGSAGRVRPVGRRPRSPPRPGDGAGGILPNWEGSTGSSPHPVTRGALGTHTAEGPSPFVPALPVHDAVASAGELPVAGHLLQRQLETPGQQRRPGPERHRGVLHPDLVEQPGVRELTGQVPTPDDPHVAVTGGRSHLLVHLRHGRL